LRNFYASPTVKKLDLDQQNAYRGEIDLAISGAPKMTPNERGLITYGTAKFNTHKNFTTLHTSFKRKFAT
jgi:hypothetical protein